MGGKAGNVGAAGATTQDGGAGSAGSSDGDACVPQPCDDGKTCGEVPDGCGGMAKCIHGCLASETCQSNSCVAVTCTEYTDAEIQQLCQGSCGYLAKKCTLNDSFNCTQYTGMPCTLSYQWCQTGTCGGCTRQKGYDIGMDQATPFAYFCPIAFDDKVQDEGETDVDCGGPRNPRKCATGKSCQQDSDCSMQACVGGQCANSSKPQIGCSWTGDHNSSTSKFVCPVEEQGCVRTPGADSSICGTISGKPYSMQCNQNQSLAAAGCVQAQPGSNMWWCCSETIQ